MQLFYRWSGKRSYFYQGILQISIHVFHFESFNHIYVDCEKFTAISDNLAARTISWHCPLNFFFISLQKTVVFWILVYYNLRSSFITIKVLDLHMAVDHRKFLALQSDIRLPIRKIYYLVPQPFIPYASFFGILCQKVVAATLYQPRTCFVFSVKLFMMLLLLYSSCFRF